MLFFCWLAVNARVPFSPSGLFCLAGAFLRVKPKTHPRQVSNRRAPGRRYTCLMLNKCERRRTICTVLLLALFVISAASLLGFAAAAVSPDAARHAGGAQTEMGPGLAVAVGGHVARR